MLADKVRYGRWVIEGNLVAAAVDGGVDEELDVIFQRCVDEGFALFFFGGLVCAPGLGGLCPGQYHSPLGDYSRWIIPER